jgi:hypothetical protein
VRETGRPRRIIVDHGNGAMRVMNQRGADRAEQAPGQRSPTAAAHHNHLRLFGQVHESRNQRGPQHFAVYLKATTVSGGCVDDFDGVLDDSAAFGFLHLADVFRERHHREHHSRPSIDRPENNNNREGHVPHRSRARGPLHRSLGAR